MIISQHLIDSHCHIQFAAYDADRAIVINRALEAGIGMINIGTQYSTSVEAIKLAEQYPNGVWATVGFHPNHVSGDTYHDPWELHEKQQERFDYTKFGELARQHKVVAVGECGLDYHRGARGRVLGASTVGQQKQVFVQQVELARELNKPLVIHCRQAFLDLIDILSSLISNFSPPGVVHFFSGSWVEAQKLLDLGFYLGFGGVITFAREYDEVIKNAPLDRLLLETDAPYVAPLPYRGKRNEPAHIVETARKIAELRQISYHEVAEATTANAAKLFRL